MMRKHETVAKQARSEIGVRKRLFFRCSVRLLPQTRMTFAGTCAA
jgi:hypothetical protein